MERSGHKVTLPDKAMFTSKSTMVQGNGIYGFTFFCDLCDFGYTTTPVVAQSTKEARERAQQEARQHFNRCQKCHRWVCDEHYNENEMTCTECTPKK